MRYAKLSCTEFILVIYSNATQLTYSYRTSGHGQKGHVNKFCSLVFLGTQHGVRGPCGVVYNRARSFEKIFYLHNSENRPSRGFFECIGKFSFCLFSFFFCSLFFLSVWSIMKVCITVILVCLNKFHIWGISSF